MLQLRVLRTLRPSGPRPGIARIQDAGALAAEQPPAHGRLTPPVRRVPLAAKWTHNRPSQ